MFKKPEKRGECFKTRSNLPKNSPCPFVSCVYNNFLEIAFNKAGPYIRYCQKDSSGKTITDPLLVDPKKSCTLDIVDFNLSGINELGEDISSGMTNDEISNVLGLSRESVRLTYYNAINKIKVLVNEDFFPANNIDLIVTQEELELDFSIQNYRVNKWLTNGLLYTEKDDIVLIDARDLYSFLKQNISERNSFKRSTDELLDKYGIKDLIRNKS